jgi:hypothetical protein
MDRAGTDENSPMPKNMAELLQRIDRDWSALLQFLGTKDEARQLYSGPGQWSIKNNLAHLAFWEKFLLLHHLQGMPAPAVLEIDPSLLRRLDEDQLNQIIYNRSQARSLAEVVSDLHQTHGRLMAELKSTDFAALQKPDRIETLIKRPLLESVVCNTYEHYREHLKTMERESSERQEK